MQSFIFDVMSTVESPCFIDYAVQATAASVSQHSFAPTVRRAFFKLVWFAYWRSAVPHFSSERFCVIVACVFLSQFSGVLYLCNWANETMHVQPNFFAIFHDCTCLCCLVFGGFTAHLCPSPVGGVDTQRANIVFLYIWLQVNEKDSCRHL